MSADHTLPALPVQDGVEFRYVKDFPDYCVGNDGSLWSWRKVRNRFRSEFPEWRRLKGNPTRRGHIRVRLTGVSGGRSVSLHRLILETFVGPSPDGMECCHEDDNPANNRLSNIRWDTHVANVLDAIRNGVFPLGNKGGLSKLTEEDIPSILRLLDMGMSMNAVARMYGVHNSQISRIASGESWKSVKRVVRKPLRPRRNQYS